jgi:hypothetical protein
MGVVVAQQRGDVLMIVAQLFIKRGLPSSLNCPPLPARAACAAPCSSWVGTDSEASQVSLRLDVMERNRAQIGGPRA